MLRWLAPFPRYPVQAGLQSNWVARRFEHLLPEASGGLFAPVPDWDQLNEAAHVQSCLPERAVGEDLVLQCLPESGFAELTAEDRELLKSPEERWAGWALPSVVTSGN